eukprot:snap_masked-scaffold_59-processed-gene-0.84-mRNA-1 protein AED:1.00 eAED:1.00 QI:0/0/0/0/1/1/2/0/151
MLKIYSKAGIIFYHKNLDLSEETNFIFFAPSFIAQVLGCFIRDSHLHQLALGLNSEIFPRYRKYIDTGIIRKLYSMFFSKNIFSNPRKRNSLIVPELIPILKYMRIRPSRHTEDYTKLKKPINLIAFLTAVLQYKKENQLKIFCCIDILQD